MKLINYSFLLLLLPFLISSCESAEKIIATCAKRDSTLQEQLMLSQENIQKLGFNREVLKTVIYYGAPLLTLKESRHIFTNEQCAEKFLKIYKPKNFKQGSYKVFDEYENKEIKINYLFNITNWHEFKRLPVASFIGADSRSTEALILIQVKNVVAIETIRIEETQTSQSPDNNPPPLSNPSKQDEKYKNLVKTVIEQVSGKL